MLMLQEIMIICILLLFYGYTNYVIVSGTVRKVNSKEYKKAKRIWKIVSQSYLVTINLAC